MNVNRAQWYQTPRRIGILLTCLLGLLAATCVPAAESGGALRSLVYTMWGGNTSTHVVEALESMPGMDDVQIAKVFQHRQKVVFHDVPTQAQLEAVDVVVLNDVPVSHLTREDVTVFRRYVESGGTLLVVNGLVSYASYADSALAGLLPVECGDLAPMVVKRKVMLPEAVALRPGAEQPFALTGISLSDAPKAHVVPVRAQPGADVLIDSESGPVLVRGKRGHGNVAFFSIATDRRRLDDPFTTWDNFDHILQQLVLQLVGHVPELVFTAVQAPTGMIAAPGQATIAFDLANRGQSDLQGSYTFTLTGPGDVTIERSDDVTLDAGGVQTYREAVALPSRSASYQYRVVLKDSTGRSMLARDGMLRARPADAVTSLILDETDNYTDSNSQWLNVAYGRGDVFQPGSMRVLPVNVQCSGDGPLELHLSIVDFSGTRIADFPPQRVDDVGEHRLEVEWHVPNVAAGAYRVIGELYKAGTPVDGFEQALTCVVERGHRDYFPFVMLYYYTPSFGAGVFDAAPWENIGADMRLIADTGLTGCGPNLYADEVIKAGLKVSVTGAPFARASWRRLNASVPIDRKAIQNHLDELEQLFKNRPNLLYTQVADEQNIGHKGYVNGENDHELFEQEYGYPMPEVEHKPWNQRHKLWLPADHYDEHWYEAARFKSRVWSEKIKEANDYVREHTTRPEFADWTALHAILVFDPVPMDFTTMFGPQGGISRPGGGFQFGHHQWGAAFITELIRGATGHRDQGISLHGPMAYMTAMEPNQAGAEAYAALSYGAKAMSFYAWWTGGGYTRQDPYRLAILKQALHELAIAGPLLLQMNSVRANVGMLFPWNSNKALTEVDGWDLSMETAWNRDFKLLRETFGQVDLVYEARLEQDASAYRYLIVPSHTQWLTREGMQRLRAYVQAGGILVAHPGTASRDEHREETDVFTSLFPEGGGAPAAMGKGWTQAIDLTAADAAQRLHDLAATHGVPLVAESSDKHIVCNLHAETNGTAYCLSMVSYSATNTTTTLRVGLPRKDYFVADLISGELVAHRWNDGILEIPVTVDRFWGRMLGIFPVKPERIDVATSQDELGAGDTFSYTVRARDRSGTVVDYGLPIRITVTDPSGRERPEYGGVRVLRRGVYEGRVPVAVNDPAGVWRVAVLENLTAGRNVIQQTGFREDIEAERPYDDVWLEARIGKLFDRKVAMVADVTDPHAGDYTYRPIVDGVTLTYLRDNPDAERGGADGVLAEFSWGGSVFPHEQAIAYDLGEECYVDEIEVTFSGAERPVRDRVDVYTGEYGDDYIGSYVRQQSDQQGDTCLIPVKRKVRRLVLRFFVPQWHKLNASAVVYGR